MILFIILSIVAVAIVFGAVRIILGWVLPAATMAKIDRGTAATFGFIGKLSIVALAGIIVWAIWTATRV